MEVGFDQAIMRHVDEACKRLQEANINAQNQLSESERLKYLEIIRDLSKEHMNLVGIHAIHLIETSSLLLSKLQGASPEEKSQIQRVCASMDQFVALVKQRK